MPRKLPPNCERFYDRHGKLRVYFRRGKNGRRIPLPVDPTTQEFEDAYRAAMEASPIARAPRVSAEPKSGTIGALIVSYKRSDMYLHHIRETTRIGYNSRLEIIRRKHGHRTLVGLNRERMLKMLDEFADRPGQRLVMLKMWRVLIQHAREKKWLNSDPSHGIKRPRSDEIAAWTDAEIAAFEARWPIGTKQRLAFALMLYTGQRRSDVHRMTWQDVIGESIKVVQQKTGARLTIPLHAALRDILCTTPREHVTVLNTAYGQPFTVDGFSGFMRDAIRAANLPLTCRPHGLRKAAGRRLAEAGASAREIMAVLGHKTLSEAERYTRDADQALLANSAMRRLEAQTQNATPQTNHDWLGEKTEKRNDISERDKRMALPRGLEPLFSP